MSRSWSMLWFVVGGGIFFLAGVVATIKTTVGPMWLAHASKAWTEGRCRIERSEVDSYIDDEGDRMYRASVEYSYDAGGARLRGDRIDFGAGSSSNIRSLHEGTIARYPEGADVACWYDPAEPSAVVLSRTIEAGLFLAFPIPFAAIGFFLLRHGLARRRDGERAVAGRADRRLHLRRGSGLIEVVCAAVLAGLFGAAAALAPSVATPLVSIGAVVVAAAAAFLAVHELRCYLSTLTVTVPERVRRGEELQARWSVQSPIGAPHGTARLVAIETSSDGDGTSSKTIRTITLHDRDRRGAGSVRIPDDEPITRDRGDDTLEWFLEVRAHLPFGPDIKVRAPITVEA